MIDRGDEGGRRRFLIPHPSLHNPATRPGAALGALLGPSSLPLGSWMDAVTSQKVPETAEESRGPSRPPQPYPLRALSDLGFPESEELTGSGEEQERMSRMLLHQL